MLDEDDAHWAECARREEKWREEPESIKSNHKMTVTRDPTKPPPCEVPVALSHSP